MSAADDPDTASRPVSTATATAAHAQVDLSDPETFVAGVPHAYFQHLRETDPVHWQPECELPNVPKGDGYWALTRYDDVSFVSKNSDLFSSELGSCVLSDLRPKDLANMREQLINMDTPGHTELRKLMNPHFKPGTVRGTEQHTLKIVSETLDALAGHSECDFVDAISAPISLRALTHFLGVPDKHSKRFYNWTNKLIGSSDPGVSTAARARIAVLEIFIYAGWLGRKRRKQPRADIFSALVNGKFRDLPLERLKLGMNFFLLLIAGNETTRNALSGGVQALCDHPEQLARLRADPALLPQAIEEMLRWVTPVMQFRRTATRDTKIGNQAIGRGDKVVMYYGAANRDPRIFETPETFDIARKPNPHLAFGTGTHFCAGSHMARLEMRTTLAELLRRFPEFQLTAPPQRLRSNFISGIKRMPMMLGAA
jgi:cholest-4-en-3-one 26-monooxygenase